MTTYRCIRLTCALRLPVSEPGDRCPRCRAALAVIERPGRDPADAGRTAMDDVLAGFERLLRAASEAA